MVQIENWQPDQDAEPRHYMTVGAVMWSQIMAFAVTNGTDTVDDLVWQSNPEYNRTWEQFGGSPWQPMFGPVGPGAREQMRRFHRLARDDTDPYGEFLDELTIYPNPALDEGHRYIIRALFDWDRRMEPERGFPLARLNRRVNVAEEGWLPVDEARRRREECEEEVGRLVEELLDSSADESEGGGEYRDRAVPQMEEHARRRLCQASSSSSDSEGCMDLVRQALRNQASPSHDGSRDRSRLRGNMDWLKHKEQNRRCHQSQLTTTPASSSEDGAGEANVTLSYDGPTRQRQWAQFAREAAAANVDEDTLMQHLDRGIVSFGRLFPSLYESLVRQFPAVYNALHIAAGLGISFRACSRDPLGPGPSGQGKRKKRSDEVHGLGPRTTNRSGDKCKALHDMGRLHSNVYVCSGIRFGAPCMWVGAPPGHCVNLPGELIVDASSFRPNGAAGSCKLYDKVSCAGLDVDIDGPIEFFAPGGQSANWNDRARSLRCHGPPKKEHRESPSPLHAQGPPTQPCDIINKLTIHFEMGGHGTWDRIDGVMEKATFLLASGPRGDYKTTRDISLHEAFGAGEVALKDINWFGVTSTKQSLLGMAWNIGGVTLTAKCADSDDEMIWDKYASFDSGYLGRNSGEVKMVWGVRIYLRDWHKDGAAAVASQNVEAQPKHDEH
ncbi:hypothetical protein PLIIFM63780_009113 [Purpureocillium lilacinum]|nr:hypothetical protein PLIIFM63780_009113 [Purpureocillium lilacinum]